MDGSKAAQLLASADVGDGSKIARGRAADVGLDGSKAVVAGAEAHLAALTGRRKNDVDVGDPGPVGCDGSKDEMDAGDAGDGAGSKEGHEQGTAGDVVGSKRSKGYFQKLDLGGAKHGQES